MGTCEIEPRQYKHIDEPKSNLGLNICQGQTQEIVEPYIKIEMLIGDNIPVPVEISNKAMKSICKITIIKYPKNIYGTGFFMKISDNQEYLITNNHIISQENINDYIEIEIYNHKIIKLNLNNRDIKYYPRPKDITMIEIKIMIQYIMI